MKYITVLLVLCLFSFRSQEEKTVTLKLTLPELETVYKALGELPAKESEGLRAKISYEYKRQITDTAAKK